MIEELKKADLKCTACGSELLVYEDKVFCQICKNQVKPNAERKRK